MDFFAVNGKRPVRLSKATRAFAYESLNHKYGLETRKNHSVSMDDFEGFSRLSDIEKYDAMIERIARLSPVRICEGERLSGSAALGFAIDHAVPATLDGHEIFWSVSHLTIDFETVLEKGVDYIEKKAEASLLKFRGTEKEAFIKSCLNCIGYMRLWHGRYLERLKRMPDLKANYEALKSVPFKAASSFLEAVQSLWFTFAFVRLCGNWPGIGRIDLLLSRYLKSDLERGALTLDEAREILAHFFIKGCEWTCGGCYGSGDAQHYQNILLAGVDRDGNEVTNPVTYLVLDVIEELGISDFPVTVRINKNTPRELISRVSEVIRLGGGVIAVYNEDLIIDSLTSYGYDPSEARSFANDGCWEVQIPGKTFFTYIPFDCLKILQERTLDSYGDSVSFSDFGELYKKFINDLDEAVCGHIEQYAKANLICEDSPSRDWKWKPHQPCTVVSLFEEGCIEKGLSYQEGGPLYNVISPHIGGLPDAVNSLYAIKKLVFDDERISLCDLMKLLKSNWQGDEALRRLALNKYSYFGNDNDEADLIAKSIVWDFANICDRISADYPFMTPAGISTFGRQLEWSHHRLATPYGKKASEVLSGNFSPTPGTDREGATAIIRSYCKSDLRRTVSGAALDIKLLPAAVNGENGIAALSSLIRGFASLGGHFMQLDIADTSLLRAAQEHPEDYENLSVRVSGWNARFVTLNKEWQDMIILQTGCEL